jgi:CheY-like chemotaxis protein
MSKKILVVDDNPDIRRLLRLSLEKPYVVIEGDDGNAALRLAEQHRPSLILLDIMMPGAMDGLQVLEALKKSPELRHIPVAILTARGQTSDFEFGMQKGADAYFIKPFSPLLLLQWITKKLG